MHSFSFGELALVFGIILVLFGGSRLASIGEALGKGISNFKKGLNSNGEEKTQQQVQETGHQPTLQVMHNVQIKSAENLDSNFPTENKKNQHIVDVNKG